MGTQNDAAGLIGGVERKRFATYVFAWENGVSPSRLFARNNARLRRTLARKRFVSSLERKVTNPAVIYERTQVGTGILVFFGVIVSIILGTTALGIAEKSVPLIIINTIVLLIILICCVIFSQMTIAVGSGKVRWQLGYGLVRRQIDASEIRSCTPIQTSGLTLGLRIGVNATLWIVSGRNAVSLSLKSGKVVALGTPDKEQLCQAIRTLIGQTQA